MLPSDSAEPDPLEIGEITVTEEVRDE